MQDLRNAAAGVTPRRLFVYNGGLLRGRARRILDRETDLALRHGERADQTGIVDWSGGRASGQHLADATDDPGRARSESVERLLEIHKDLLHDRQVARRPFNRRADRLVLATAVLTVAVSVLFAYLRVAG